MLIAGEHCDLVVTESLGGIASCYARARRLPRCYVYICTCGHLSVAVYVFEVHAKLQAIATYFNLGPCAGAEQRLRYCFILRCSVECDSERYWDIFDRIAISLW